MKIYLRACCLSALLLVLPGPGGATAQAGPLKMACYADYYPYASVDRDGVASGVLIDLWRLWSEKTGTPVSFVPLPMHEAIEQVARGELDAHCGLFFSRDRTRRLADQPAFLLGGNSEEFYIRAQASSQPLGLRDAHEYISSRWWPPR